MDVALQRPTRAVHAGSIRPIHPGFFPPHRHLARHQYCDVRLPHTPDATPRVLTPHSIFERSITSWCVFLSPEESCYAICHLWRCLRPQGLLCRDHTARILARIGRVGQLLPLDPFRDADNVLLKPADWSTAKAISMNLASHPQTGPFQHLGNSRSPTPDMLAFSSSTRALATVPELLTVRAERRPPALEQHGLWFTIARQPDWLWGSGGTAGSTCPP